MKKEIKKKPLLKNQKKSMQVILILIIFLIALGIALSAMGYFGVI